MKKIPYLSDISYCFPKNCKSKCHKYYDIPKYYDKTVLDLSETNHCENK